MYRIIVWIFATSKFEPLKISINFLLTFGILGHLLRATSFREHILTAAGLEIQ